MSESNTFAIQEIDKMVVIAVPPNTSRIVIDPATARAAADQMAKSAYIAEFGVHPDNSLKAAAIDEKHKKMVARVSVMLNSLSGKSNKHKAQEICDVIFSELT